ncbi:MAG: FAD-dependent oxidoreductase [Oscillospiraceae bacterium]|nr:FAD-dependent oxidoreductase [Oscillospiraceae bacterium]
MKSKYVHLFQPIRLGGLVLRNRVIATSGVCAGDIHTAARISAGGAAMVCSCMTAVACEKSDFYAGAPYAFSNGQYGKSPRDAVRRETRLVRRGGAKFAVELSHVGEYYRPAPGDFAWGVVDKINARGDRVKAMDETAMAAVAEAYAQTARDALELGYDAILFDCASGWLMSQFLSPHYNTRTDAYGGSIENRAVFPLKVLRAVRQAVGRHTAVLCQIPGNEYFSDGAPFEDMIAFVEMAQPDIDAVLINCGNDQNRLQMTKMISTNLEPHLMTAAYTEALKKQTAVPVVLLGAVMNPNEAEAELADGRADMVGLSRPLIADPDFVNKAAENRAQDITPCLRCNSCFHVSTAYKCVGCSVNPDYTQQPQPYPMPTPAPAPRKKVVVAGAGPAGIRAALAAKACGHEVVLVEKEDEIGGLLRVIALERCKTEIAAYLAWLKRQVQNANITLLLNTPATKALLEKLQPDKLIVAIGAQEIVPPIAGAGQAGIYTAPEAIRRMDALPQKIAVVGGGTVGAELALELAETGREVTLIEMTGELASSANLLYRLALLDRVARCGKITVLTDTRCIAAQPGFVTVEKQSGRASIEAGCLVAAAGSRPRTEEAFGLFGIVEDTVTAGNVNKAGNIIDATWEGDACGRDM